MSDKHLFKNVEREIKKRGWSRMEFCKRIGISPQVFNNWRLRGVPLRRVVTVAEMFAWDIDDVIRKPNNLKEPKSKYKNLTSQGHDFAMRWQALPPCLQAHMLDAMESAERLRKKVKPGK